VALAVEAQPPAKVYRIGWLSNTPSPQVNEVLLQNLHELGWVEGRNIVFERRSVEGRIERFPALAGELVQLKPDLIVVWSTAGTASAQKATTTIPIVFGDVGDPVGSGFVASLARPGGNITGSAGLGGALHVKMVELLKETVPEVARPAVLWNPGFAIHTEFLKQAETTARALGLTLQRFEARGAEDLEGAFAAMARARVQAVVVFAQPLILARRAQVVKLADEKRLPAIYGHHSLTEAGGLMSYSGSLPDQVRIVARYIDRILRGTRPADLPVERATRVTLVVNLKAARAIGLTLPPSLLLRADRVIE